MASSKTQKSQKPTAKRNVKPGAIASRRATETRTTGQRTASRAPAMRPGVAKPASAGTRAIAAAMPSPVSARAPDEDSLDLASVGDLDEDSDDEADDGTTDDEQRALPYEDAARDVGVLLVSQLDALRDVDGPAAVRVVDQLVASADDLAILTRLLEVMELPDLASDLRLLGDRRLRDAEARLR